MMKPGRFGQYGGRYVAETLMQPLLDLEVALEQALNDSAFTDEYRKHLKTFVGRETPLYFAENLSRDRGVKIYLKREDLCHLGSHKINNSLGQVLLAKRMNKKRIIAETGAGQHGVATAAASARFGLECVVYMGSEDVRRQNSNVKRMELLGAKVIAVESGSKTLKDAVSEAMRDWVSNVQDSYYVLGSALGPHPYPTMVKHFQSVIGEEAKSQILETEGRLPDEIIACVGGGSNAIGIFSAFLQEGSVRLFGVEAGGVSPLLGNHAARFQGGSRGVFQGTETFVLQNEQGQIVTTQSISAGLDYAAVGPEHSFLRETKRVTYDSITDSEALDAFKILTRREGIIPALESSHAVAYGLKRAELLPKDSIIIINLSGRGDKDLSIIEDYNV
jgi:tryptophan synthase beta chain